MGVFEKAIENDILRDPVDRKLSEPPKPSLFNLDKDPYEQDDLSVSSPQRLEIMQKQLEDWFEKVLRDRASISD